MYRGVYYLYLPIRIEAFADQTKSLSADVLSTRLFPISGSSFYNRSWGTSAVENLTDAKFNPLYIFLSGFSISRVPDICVVVILSNLSVLPIQFCVQVTRVWNFESRLQITDPYELWKIFQWSGESVEA
jgi:hypothetical protein